MSDMKTGEICEVFRGAYGYDCTAGGVSSRCKELTLVGSPGSVARYAPTPERPAVKIVTRWEGTPREYKHVELAEPEHPGMIGPMFGGNFLRVPRDLCPYPLPIHDRYETPETYRSLSD